MKQSGDLSLDREILRLAVPAFGALAAEPLYVLADTAIVGHLGTRPLGGLGVAATVLTAASASSTSWRTARPPRVARRIGRGRREGRGGTRHRRACGSRSASGSRSPRRARVRRPIVHAMGASARVAPYARTYLRISLLGAPFVLLALAGTGYLRGLQDTRTPLVHRAGGERLQPRARDRPRLRHPPRHRRLGVGNGRRATRRRGSRTSRSCAATCGRRPRRLDPTRARLARGRDRRRAPHHSHRHAVARVHERDRDRGPASATCRSPRTRSRGRSGTSSRCALDAIADRGPGHRRQVARRGRHRAYTGGVAPDVQLGGDGRRRARRARARRRAPVGRDLHARPRGPPRASAGPRRGRRHAAAGAAVFVLDGILIGAGDTRYLALGDGSQHDRCIPFRVRACSRRRPGSSRSGVRSSSS